MSGLGAPHDDAVALTPEHLLAAFRAGEVVGPEGPLRPSAALVTARSLLLMTARSVLKLRRPRRVAGVDMTTRARRAWATEQELWIGRRASPETYLGDASMRWDGERYELLPTLSTAEPVVAMRRLPDGRRADEVLSDPAVEITALRPVLERLAWFHEDAPLHRAHDGWGAPGRMRRRWAETLARLPEGDNAPLDAGTRARLADETEAWLTAIDKHLVHRVTEGRIRHLHGDLRLEHVYLTDPVAIIDPAEEGDERHWSDTAEDVAVLALELRALGRPDLAATALDVYSGLTFDRTLRFVTPFFLRLVAIRRAADELALADHLPPEDRPACALRARFFADLALNVR